MTPAERRLLKDPDWIDEDESNLLLAMWREAEEGNKAIPFERSGRNLATDWTISFLPGTKRELRFLRIEVSERVFGRILETISDLLEDTTRLIEYLFGRPRTITESELKGIIVSFTAYLQASIECW